MNRYVCIAPILMLIVFLNFSCSNKGFQREGLLYYYSKMVPNPIDTMLRQNQIWFQDSAIIYEMKIFTTTEDHKLSGTVIHKSYNTFKFTYLDLRTLRCQDYYNFSDTALPYCNYFLKPDEWISWKFYAENNKQKVTDSLTLLPDTVMDGHHFKRVKTVNLFPGSDFEFVYWLRCKETENIFHINQVYEKRFPGCKTTRTELIDPHSSSHSIFGYNILHQRLSDEERKIFKKWAKNATQTTLPLLTLDKALKVPIHNPALDGWPTP